MRLSGHSASPHIFFRGRGCFRIGSASWWSVWLPPDTEWSFGFTPDSFGGKAALGIGWASWWSQLAAPWDWSVRQPERTPFFWATAWSCWRFLECNCSISYFLSTLALSFVYGAHLLYLLFLERTCSIKAIKTERQQWSIGDHWSREPFTTSPPSPTTISHDMGCFHWCDNVIVHSDYIVDQFNNQRVILITDLENHKPPQCQHLYYNHSCYEVLSPIRPDDIIQKSRKIDRTRLLWPSLHNHSGHLWPCSSNCSAPGIIPLQVVHVALEVVSNSFFSEFIIL